MVLGVWGGVMPTYRFYRVKKGGHFTEPPELADLSDDETAVEHARRLADDTPVEVWDGARRVTVVRVKRK